MFESRDHVRRFVAELKIPESRRAIVEAELFDHFESRLAAELAAGESPDKAEHNALAALGDPATLRRSLERVEAAFELDPRSTTLRGLLAAVVTSVLFGVLGEAFQVDGPYGVVVGIGALIAPVGAIAIWLLAPLGIGAALVAEARATVLKPTPTPRRRATKGYVLSFVIWFHAVWPALGLVVVPERVRDEVLMSWGVLGLVYGTWALLIMRAARAERLRHA